MQGVGGLQVHGNHSHNLECTRKWLMLDQTVRNLTSGDLGTPFVVIRLGVTRLKKIFILSKSI